MENQTIVCLPPQQIAITPVNQNTNQPPNHPGNTCTINHQNDLPSFRQKIVFDIKEEFKRSYTTEILIASTYLWILKSTSFNHLVLAFELLEEKTGPSNSISPVVMSFFKYSLTLITSISITCADVRSRLLRSSTTLKRMVFVGTGLGIPLAHLFRLTNEDHRKVVFYISDVIYLSCTGGFNGYGKHGWLLNFAVYMLTLTIISSVGFRAKYSSDWVLIFSILVSSSRGADDLQLLTSSAPSLLCCIDESLRKFLPMVATHLKLTLKEKNKVVKFVKYAIGLAGMLIFQYFFQLSTFRHVRAFMYLATSWLANTAMTNVSNDYGILNFLLGNMVLGSTVNQSGLGISTWISYCGCLLLYVLGIKLKSMNITQNIEKLPKPPMIFWIFYCVVSVDSLFLYNYY